MWRRSTSTRWDTARVRGSACATGESMIGSRGPTTPTRLATTNTRISACFLALAACRDRAFYDLAVEWGAIMSWKRIPEPVRGSQGDSGHGANRLRRDNDAEVVSREQRSPSQQCRI